MDQQDNAKNLRRHPLAKEKFAEGNRQRWAGIFTLIGLVVMVATSYGWLKDPAPFLQFFLSIGVTFILGASASDVMKAWKIESVNAQETRIDTIKQDITENQNTNIKEEYTEHIIHEGGENSPSRRPFSRLNDEEYYNRLDNQNDYKR